MSQEYYDGAYDALTEAMQEIEAAWVYGHRGIERQHYDTDIQFWKAVMQATLEALQDSYKKDGIFIQHMLAKRGMSDAARMVQGEVS